MTSAIATPSDLAFVNLPVKTFQFSNLPHSDLHVDALYVGGRRGNYGDDPYNPLLKVSVGGGFRYRGSVDDLEVVVLTSDGRSVDWPDELDRETGIYTYYGDNRSPGLELHETPRKGNELLRRLFELAHGEKPLRSKVPPIFVFESAGRKWRDAVFLGLAVPGSSELKASEDLVAVWKTSGGRRFQNYRARFTILDIPVISRTWLDEIIGGHADTPNAPRVWRRWIETGVPEPLLAERTIEHRTPAEQVPADRDGIEVISRIHSWFADRPHDFEHCAGDIARLLLPDITALDVTRPSRDGGRDAVGHFRIGDGRGAVHVEFALEAKCYELKNSVGVREMSRLISRLRHRQFGILVTTSFVNLPAYKEIKEDMHPIIIICASDILALLKKNGRGDAASVDAWLAAEYPARVMP